MNINNEINIFIPDVSRGYFESVRKHIRLIKENANTIAINPIDSHSYRGNLSGLLAHLRIDPILFYPILLINNLPMNNSYPDNIDYLLVPNGEILDNLVNAHLQS